MMALASAGAIEPMNMLALICFKASEEADTASKSRVENSILSHEFNVLMTELPWRHDPFVLAMASV
jgi:hypothetical protein